MYRSKPIVPINTGQVEIDRILNQKIEEAFEHQITVKTAIAIPKEIDVSKAAIVTIYGSLMDHGIEAEKHLEQGERILDLKTKYDRGRLLIQITNTFAGEPVGIAGISSIKKALAKYHGDISFGVSEDGRLFEAVVIMYVDLIG